jgi:hypothetical protein
VALITGTANNDRTIASNRRSLLAEKNRLRTRWVFNIPTVRLSRMKRIERNTPAHRGFSGRAH